ncbi:hypothetical protein N5923_06650 [Erwiniaceae bacterium BAC15a-03b]|uniref:Uncharacterized protein n=1 Tax=Winslowiella arboricola TaxID=2978220 RepID=A0A9J6PL41_9GAMM|nr:hypothetical protein [Winslowiella arboricola]MCU5772867.1 hypothetical protein [Winslowiella arboricola]MCU5777171.1 hypothetical protein [Winslowiella arboricola]
MSDFPLVPFSTLSSVNSYHTTTARTTTTVAQHVASAGNTVVSALPTQPATGQSTSQLRLPVPSDINAMLSKQQCNKKGGILADCRTSPSLPESYLREPQVFANKEKPFPTGLKSFTQYSENLQTSAISDKSLPLQKEAPTSTGSRSRVADALLKAGQQLPVKTLTSQQQQFLYEIIAERDFTIDPATRQSESNDLNYKLAKVLIESRPRFRDVSELNQLSKFINNEYPLTGDWRRDLKAAIFRRMREVTISDPASYELAMNIAFARITAPEDPESCLKVALDHGIKPHSAEMDMLQIKAVKEGIAGKYAAAGVNCFVICDQFGITKDSNAMVELQLIAVRDAAEQHLLDGASCFEIAEILGIGPQDMAMEVLTQMTEELMEKKHILSGIP